MAIRVKDDTKRTHHVTLEGHSARVMDAMILMSKGNAQFVISGLVEDEYKRSRTAIDKFIAEHKTEVDAMQKPAEKRNGKAGKRAILGVVGVEKKSATA